MSLKNRTPQLTFPTPTKSDRISREDIEEGKKVKTKLTVDILTIQNPCISLIQNGKRYQTNRFVATAESGQRFMPTLNDVLYLV